LPSYDAESGSLAFRPRHFLSLPSDPAVTSNALASRIVFPLVKGDPAFFQAGGFLGFAKHTKKALNNKLFSASKKKRLATTCSPTVLTAVPSALEVLTTEFGMGSGVAPPLWLPAGKCWEENLVMNE
jgi:hypothetical protein